MPHESFGDFLCEKRLEKNISLSAVAQELGYSVTYVSSVERNQRNPYTLGKLQQLRTILSLSEDEYIEMLDLAGRERNTISPDLPEYVMEHKCVLRCAKLVI